MPDNCTIYCKSPDNGELTQLIQASFKTSTEDAEGSKIVHGHTGSMRISHNVFQKPGDSFSKLVRSTAVHVKQLMPQRKNTAENPLIQHIYATELAIGIVVEPGYDADERYGDLVFEIAKTLDGVIFNGSDFLNHECESLTEKHS